MNRRTRGEWERIISEFERSGEAHEEFCARRRLGVGSFRSWLYDLRAERKAGKTARSATKAVRMLPVRVREQVPEPSLVEMIASSVRVRVPVGADVVYVAELARALLSRC